MTTRNIGNVAEAIHGLVSKMGLEKISADIADPGTAQPAEQEADRSQIEDASEGARSSENSSDVKKEVIGQSIDQASPGGADNKGSASSTENITTGSFVGEDPSVEKDYQGATPDPGTSHPANTNQNEKYSSEQIQKAASDITAEMAEIQKNAGEELAIENAEQAREKLAELLIPKEAGEKTAAEKDAAVDSAVGEYVEGFAKSASLVGILTADYFDGQVAQMRKDAGLEEMGGGEMPPEALMEGAIPAEALEAGVGEEGAEMDEEAMALAEAATEVADELGVEPEDVLDAALAEVEGEGGVDEGGMPEEGAPEDVPLEGIEAAASANDTPEVAEMKKKAEAYDKMVAEKNAADADAKHQEIIAATVHGALDNWYQEKSKATASATA